MCSKRGPWIVDEQPKWAAGTGQAASDRGAKLQGRAHDFYLFRFTDLGRGRQASVSPVDAISMINGTHVDLYALFSVAV